MCLRPSPSEAQAVKRAHSCLLHTAHFSRLSPLLSLLRQTRMLAARPPSWKLWWPSADLRLAVTARVVACHTAAAAQLPAIRAGPSVHGQLCQHRPCPTVPSCSLTPAQFRFCSPAAHQLYMGGWALKSAYQRTQASVKAKWHDYCCLCRSSTGITNVLYAAATNRSTLEEAVSIFSQITGIS